MSNTRGHALTSRRARWYAGTEEDVMPETAPEGHLEALLQLARVRFGASRAEALRPELEALAAELARVTEAEVPDDGEPGFLMRED